MKTEAEFVAAVNAFWARKKKNSVVASGIALLTFGVALGMIFILEFAHLISDQLLRPLCAFSGILAVIPAVSYSVWYNRKAATESGLVCESCGKVVVKPSDLLSLIKSHNCPSCGRLFFN